MAMLDTTEPTVSELAPPGPTIYDAAVDLVKRERKCGISFVQRRLGIGYTVSARIIERMESEGIVSSPNSKGEREVLT